MCPRRDHHKLCNFFESSSIVGFSISIIIIIMQSNFDMGSVIGRDDFLICNIEILLQGKRKEIFDFAELLLSSSISPQDDGNLAIVGSNWR